MASAAADSRTDIRDVVDGILKVNHLSNNDDIYPGQILQIPVHVTVSLARNAMWYQSLGLIPKKDIEFAINPFQKIYELSPLELIKIASSLGKRLSIPDAIIRDTPLGEVRRLAPAVTYSATPAYWNDLILSPMGSAKPEWIL